MIRRTMLSLLRFVTADVCHARAVRRRLAYLEREVWLEGLRLKARSSRAAALGQLDAKLEQKASERFADVGHRQFADEFGAWLEHCASAGKGTKAA